MRVTRLTVLSALIAAASIVPLGSSAGAAGCWSYSDAERQLAAVTNQARQNVGLRSLALDPELSRVAARHSYWMTRLDRLYHSQRLAWKVTNWTGLGENVGVGGSIGSLQRAFLASPAHRANILSRDFVYFGVAVRSDARGMWVTVVFESYRDPGTRLRMPC